MSQSARTNPRSRSTLHDVARAAGVSASTVSSVLSGNSGRRRISEETHQRVMGAATALGYTPNLLHRSMRQGRTQVISLFNAFRSRQQGDLYMDRLAGAIEQAGGELGYDILVHSNFRRGVEETYEFLNGGFSDGLVLFGSTADEPLLPYLRSSTLPTVLIAPREADPTLSSVLDDEAMGIRLIAEALAARGHRHIATLSEERGRRLDPTGRVPRLQRELEAQDIALDPRAMLVWRHSASDAVAHLRSLTPRPTAIFVWHDSTAYRIVEACEAQGLRIPEDISVVGYDGIVWPSTSAHIVATVQVPVDRMAESGVAILNRLIEGESGLLTQTLPVQFLPGTTLGPAPFDSLA